MINKDKKVLKTNPDKQALKALQGESSQDEDDLQGPSFDDLQPCFDEQCRRLAVILDRPEAQVTTLNRSACSTFRIRMLRAWAGLALFGIAISVYWGINLWQYNCDKYLIALSFAIEVAFILISIYSISNAVTLFRYNPATASLDITLHYARRLRMRPSYLSRNKPSHTSTGFRTGRRLPRQKPVVFQFPAFNLQRTVTIGFAVIFTLVMVSCATTIGDGFIMTQNHPARVEAVNSLAKMLANL